MAIVKLIKDLKSEIILIYYRTKFERMPFDAISGSYNLTTGITSGPPKLAV